MNQPCVSACHLHQINPPDQSLLPRMTRACAYYDFFTTPNHEVLETRCAIVNEEEQCEAFAGLGEYTLGEIGSTCGELELIDSVILPPGQSSCCPNGTTSGLVEDTFVCLLDDASYVGPPLSVIEPICTPGGCDTRVVSMLPGVGVVRGVNETAQEVCDACAFQELGDPCPGDCDSVGCFEGFLVEPPLEISTPNVTATQGICGGGVCVGPINQTLVGSNLMNDQCQPGHCRTVLKEEFANLRVSNPALWPTPSCNPLCPGYPDCDFECPGWPNVQDSLMFLEPKVSDLALEERKPCRQPTSCVSASVCNQGVCTSIQTSEPICEQAACRICGFSNNTCTGPAVPAGSRCRIGCAEDEIGECDGMGNCIATSDVEGICRPLLETAGILAGRDAKDLDCFQFNCSSTIPDLTNPNVTLPTIFKTDFSAIKSNDVDTLVDNTFRQLFNPTNIQTGFRTNGLSLCSITAKNVGLPCDDNNLCLVDEVCTSNGFCQAQNEFNTICQYTNCSACNPATGLCDGNTTPGRTCYTECGIEQTQGRIGTCQTDKTCSPLQLDDSVDRCLSTGPNQDCLDGVCVGSFLPSFNPVQPAFKRSIGGNIFNVSMLAQFATFECGETFRQDGISCRTDRNGPMNFCLLSQTCQNGTCVTQSEVDCTTVGFDNPCANASLSVCNPADGMCFPGGVENGTECVVNDVCRSSGVCSTPAPVAGLPAEPICLTQPSINCSAEAVNPCVESSVCRENFADGSPFCFSTFVADDTVCQIPDSGLCTPNGNCQSGICIPNDIDCPPLSNPCQLPFCDPLTGSCTTIDLQDMTDCSDGLKCTSNDQCLSGLCLGTPVNCLPPPSQCLLVEGCFESEPGDGCRYQQAADGTECVGGLGACLAGECVPQCPEPCLNGGTCVFDSLPRPVCDCPPGFGGLTCNEVVEQESTLPLFGTSDVTGLVKTFAGFLLLIFVTALVLGLFLTLLCTFVGPDYEPDVRIEKRSDK